MASLLFPVRLSPSKSQLFFSATVRHATEVAVKEEVESTLQAFRANTLLSELIVKNESHPCKLLPFFFSDI